MSGEAWGFVFLMLALKIPIVYLGVVVWYAIKAEPEPDVDEQQDFSIWRPWRTARGPTPAPRRPARLARLGPGAAGPAR